MALSQYTIAEVRQNGTSTGGCLFDPGQYAGMYTDGAATSATGTDPVFSSASYNFVSGDVGAWVYIYTGTNWTAGWYKIVSVASNVATLNGAIGQAVKLTTTGTIRPDGPSTTVGCATTSSPTGATWSIDYSQQDAVAFTYTDLASAGAGLTVSSAAKPFNKQHVGNGLNITSGTNFTAGRYVIASVAANVATVVGPGNITTGVGSGGNGGLGGAVDTIGRFSASVAGNIMYITGTFSRTVNADSCSNPGSADKACIIEGYGTVRGDGWMGRYDSTGFLNTTNFAVLQYTTGRFLQNSAYCCHKFLSITQTGSTGSIAFQTSSYCSAYGIRVSASGGNVNQSCIYSTFSANCDIFLSGANGLTAIYELANNVYIDCIVSSTAGTAPAILLTTNNSKYINCLFFSCSGVTVYTTSGGAYDGVFSNCTFTGGGSDALYYNANQYCHYIFNRCLFTDNSGYGMRTGFSSVAAPILHQCAFRNNSSGTTNFNRSSLFGAFDPPLEYSGSPSIDYQSSGSANPLGYALIQQSPAYGVGTFGANIGALPKGAGRSVSSPLSRGTRRKKLP